MQYYYTQNGHQYGPFTLEELQQKSINKDTLIWRPGMDKWVGAGELAELSTIFPPIVPGPPPLPNNAYIPYHAPATPKGDRSWIGIAAAVGLAVVFAMFLLWKLNQRDPYAEPEDEEAALINPNGLADREIIFQPDIESKPKADPNEERSAFLRDNWPDMLKTTIVEAKYDAFGGMSDVFVRVENQMEHDVQLYVVEAIYVLGNGGTWKREEYAVRDIPANGKSDIIQIAGSHRGRNIQFEPINIICKGIGIHQELLR